MTNIPNKNMPMAYPDWVNSNGYYSDVSQQAYLAYLNSWYAANNKIYHNDDKTLQTRQQYIQLIKDLLKLLNSQEEQDLFLKDIDFDNDEDLMYVIPYLASKLKQISQIISEKREEIKKAKIKDSMIGSNQALEKVLYEYVLKNFTAKPYSWTRVPVSSLQNQFPQLSSIKDDFYIEVEELYDTNTYHDSDPSVLINNYFDLTTLLSAEPYNSLTSDELSALITSRLLLRVAPNKLSNVYQNYLNIAPQLSTYSLSGLSASYTKSIINQIAATQTYMGETLYGLTAIRLADIPQPDSHVLINIENGNNWFYWPSGDKGPDTGNVGNIFAPIPINESNLLLGRTVTGSNYTDSDLIFTSTNGVLQGAWLQGYRNETEKDTMSVGLLSEDITEFIYPWVGFSINTKDLTFDSYSLNDLQYKKFQLLNQQKRNTILQQYYNNTLPNSASYDIYLNQSSLVYSGAHAGYSSDLADIIKVSPSAFNYPAWNDNSLGIVKQAYLYKFDKTDIYIPSGITDIHWPIESYTSGTDNLTLTLSSDTCNPINLGSLDPSKTMVGSIAGQTFGTADVIYKLSDSGGNPVEAAWLGAGSITLLDPLIDAISVYQTSAVNCAQFIDGPIQSSLTTVMQPGQYTSFIWCDKDTPANEVFHFVEHASDCPYGATFPHDFYTDQDYQNPTPLNSGKKFPLTANPCTCGAINYAPIGTQGLTPKDYNGMADLLFADPQCLGSDFTYAGYRDTRNFDALTSPQFAFYQIDGNLDKNVGFGYGNWVNGNGTPMILKTGRRYTYYRSNLRINSASPSLAPYLYVKYPYQEINVNCGPAFFKDVDMVILIDHSKTQTFDLATVKTMAAKVCETAYNSSPNAQIAIVSFDANSLVLNYLTTDYDSMINSINSIKIPTIYPDWKTNIVDGLKLAGNVLFTNQPAGNTCSYNINDLCVGLETKIYDITGNPYVTNCPRASAQKTIVLFTDGQETLNLGKAVPYANLLKQNGVIIYGIDIGYYALTDNVLQQISSHNYYYNLQQYLQYSDVDLNRFIELITTLVLGCFPSVPTWCKATRDNGGNWTALNIPSDIILNPGDYLSYVHQNNVFYLGQTTNDNFTLPGVSFSLNVKLDGWDYTTSSYSLSNLGDLYGGKPFWGSFVQTTTGIPIGGGSRVMDQYVVLHQPLVSDLILSNGNYISYQNYGSHLRWDQELTFNVTLTTQQWNKLNIYRSDSNLSSTLNTNNISDYVIEATNEPSDFVLDSYTTLTPAKYVYHLASTNAPFTFYQPLYYVDRCNASFVTFTSGVILEAITPYENLDNIHYPTIANINFPSTFVTESTQGAYLLPDRLGVSYYRGFGYDIKLDPTSLTLITNTSAELVFPEPEKYGSRNRGLTKKDQLAPVSIVSIDNRWMFQPFTAGNYSGVIRNPQNNQKLVPYQSNYEINKNNQFGLALQKDDFYFWNPDFYNVWTDQKNYPLTFRNELVFSNFLSRVDALLSDNGTQINWRTDIYGNNFGLFKFYDYSPTNYLLSEDGKVISIELGLRVETE
jgi:von Willebrand factor type A domain